MVGFLHLLLIFDMKIQIKVEFFAPFITVYFINQRYFILVVANFSLLSQSVDCLFSKPQEFTCLPQLQII